jgi:hypothetical protein
MEWNCNFGVLYCMSRPVIVQRVLYLILLTLLSYVLVTSLQLCRLRPEQEVRRGVGNELMHCLP